METIYKHSILMALEFILLFCLIMGVPYVVYLDVIVFKNGVSERSLTEFLQQAFILISAALFYWNASLCPRSRSFLLLIGSFFACMFIRESDGYLDKINHGFWIYPAMFLALASISYAVKYNRYITETIHNYLNSRAYYFILIGLLITLAFSRVFGSGNLFWEVLMGNHYDRIYKATIQEGLELLGYVFVLYGSVFSLNNLKQDHVCEY